MSDNCPNQNLLLIRAFPEINVREGGGGCTSFKILLVVVTLCKICVKKYRTPSLKIVCILIPPNNL